MMRNAILLVVLLALLTGCAADLMGQDWQAAKADGEAARAAAEWARTQQVQAEVAAAAREAPARERARTLTLIALSVVGVLTLAGLGSALVAWSWMRARLVYADKTGLYPVVIGAAPATNLNEPGAQHARIAPHRTPIQVLPPADADAIPAIPEPIEIDARRMQHIERLLLQPPASASSVKPAGSVNDDSSD